MTDLDRFRDHCRKMATAEHKPECPSITAREPYWPMWAPVDQDGKWDTSGGPIRALGWLGPKPKWEPPKCDGCVTDADRALFARLASEVDDYQSEQGALWGESA